MVIFSAATSSGTLVPSIKYVSLPNKERGPKEHSFATNRQQLIDTVLGWLNEQKL